MMKAKYHSLLWGHRHKVGFHVAKLPKSYKSRVDWYVAAVTFRAASTRYELYSTKSTAVERARQIYETEAGQGWSHVSVDWIPAGKSYYDAANCVTRRISAVVDCRGGNP